VGTFLKSRNNVYCWP